MADGYPTRPTLGTDALETKNSPADGLRSPLRGFRFTANFQGLGTTSFKEVQGFSSEVDSTEYREGGFGSLTKRKLPGLVNYGDITLTKGMYQSTLLYDYYNDYLEGNNVTPVDATITVYDNAGQATAVWYVANSWPKQYSATDLSAEDSSILIETLVLAHEGIYRGSL